MRTKLSFIGLLAMMVLAGCGNENTALDENALRATADVGKTRYEIIQKAQGDWNKLSAEDKKAFVDTFKGDAKAAEAYFNGVKGGPPGAMGPTGPTR